MQIFLIIFLIFVVSILVVVTDETYQWVWGWIVEITKHRRIFFSLLFITLLCTLVYDRRIFPLTNWPEWTGFDKTLWDLADLLLVPIVLALGGFFLSRIQRYQDREIAKEQREQDLGIAERERETDRQIADQLEKERALQGFIDGMKELLLEKRLLQSAAGDPVRDVAKTLTLSILHRLDGKHNEIALRFLMDANVITTYRRKPIKGVFDFSGVNLRDVDFKGMVLPSIDLREASLYKSNFCRAGLMRAIFSGADLSEAILREAILRGADLSDADLSGADLSEAILSGAILRKADLRETILRKANLTQAILRGTNLSDADLRGANLSDADLRGAILRGAILRKVKYNKNTIWPDGIDFKAAGAIFVEE